MKVDTVLLRSAVRGTDAAAAAEAASFLAVLTLPLRREVTKGLSSTAALSTAAHAARFLASAGVRLLPPWWAPPVKALVRRSPSTALGVVAILLLVLVTAAGAWCSREQSV